MLSSQLRFKALALARFVLTSILLWPLLACAAGTSAGGPGGVSGGAGGAAGARGPTGGKGGGTGACDLWRVQGEGFVLNVLASGQMASLEISTAELQAWVGGKRPANTKWQALLLPLFDDRFFWHLYVMRENAFPRSLLAENVLARDVAQGLGVTPFVHRVFMVRPKLAASLYLADDRQISSGTLLHEMMHTWANYLVPTFGEMHWDDSDVNGLLGGMPRGAIQDRGGGVYAADYVTGRNSAPLAADIEMYLAGFWPKEKVQPFHWLTNGVFQSVEPDGRTALYKADSLETFTIEDIIANNGPRVPDSKASQRDFPLLPIVVTDKPLGMGDWNLYLRQLASLSATSKPARYVDARTYFSPPNERLSSALSDPATFAAAMHDEATLHLGDAAAALVKEGATCVPLPARGDACLRLSKRASACDIAGRFCTVDDDFTDQDAACIAGCAEQVSCEDLRTADLGVPAGRSNAYIDCTQSCQCTKERNCF